MKPALQILVRRLRDLFSVARSKVSALLRKPGDGASAPAESVIVYEPERTRDWLEEKLRERESEIAALKAAHADELRRRDEALAARAADLETAREKFSARLLDERALSRKALDAQKTAHAEELARREASHADEIARLKNEHEQKIDSLRKGFRNYTKTEDARKRKPKTCSATNRDVRKECEEIVKQFFPSGEYPPKCSATDYLPPEAPPELWKNL